VFPSDLGIVVGNDEPRWMSAVTVGYERSLIAHNGLGLSPVVPTQETSSRPTSESTYGSDPNGVKLYLRVSLVASPSGP